MAPLRVLRRSRSGLTWYFCFCARVCVCVRVNLCMYSSGDSPLQTGHLCMLENRWPLQLLFAERLLPLVSGACDCQRQLGSQAKARWTVVCLGGGWVAAFVFIPMCILLFVASGPGVWPCEGPFLSVCTVDCANVGGSELI